MWSCVNMQNISLSTPSAHSSNTVNFRVPSPDWSHPFLATLIFDHDHTHFTWNCISIQKNQVVPSVRSYDTVNFRVRRPDWPHSFLTMPHKKHFNQLLIFVNSYQHINFHYKTNLEKLMTKFFFKLKKPCFWPTSPILGAKNVFTKKLACTW